MIQFEIYGDPVPQKQTRFTRTGVVYDPSSKQKDALIWQMKPYAPRSLILGPIKVDLTFFFQPCKSTSGIKRRQMLNGVIHHIKKPDIDNLAYIITNAMKKVFYGDDAQIIDLSLHKRYHESSHTVVRIIPIEEIAPTRGDDVLKF